jgi:ABC-type uncharacterized transport system permease subunit
MRWIRPLAVLAAVLAVVAVWVVATRLFGVELRAPSENGSPGPSIGVGTAALEAAVAALAGWGLLALLERLTARARPIWVVVAIVALLLSLTGPLGGSGVSAANRAVLVLMHFTVAAVLIPGLLRRRGGPAPRDGRGRRPVPGPRARSPRSAGERRG